MDSLPEVSMLSVHYPPEPTGNAPYTGGLAEGLRAMGYQVTAHVAYPHVPEWLIREGDGQWTRVDRLNDVEVIRRRHYVPNPPRGSRRLLAEVSFGIRLLFAPLGHPRVVIAVSPALFATALAVLRLRFTPRRPKIVVWVQDVYTLGIAETSEGGKLAQLIMKWVESHTMRAADRVVVIHQSFAEYVIGVLGVPAEKVSVIRNWTHLPPSEPLDRQAAKATLGWPNDVALAVQTGSIGVKQGLENVVAAARIADERGAPVHFVLVGDGGARKELEERGRGVSRITFVDPLDDDKYRLALHAADVLLVNEKPGVSGMALPSKLTSYFDAGRPVVAATDPGGITASEVTAADAGLIVQAGDPGALVDAVLELSEDPQAADAFGQNGRRYRESVLHRETAFRKWSTIIDDLG